MKRLTEKQKLEIIEKYKTGKYTCADLGREYDRTRKNINHLLRRSGITINRRVSHSKRLYTLNQYYFDSIDTEEKAYFLGLLYADGYNNQQRFKISLKLQCGDLEILEKFNQEINSNRPIKLIKQKIGQNCFLLRISSIPMSDRLAELGCFQAKSLTLKFPTEEQVPSHLIRHFIRGYFDGDGSFTKGKRKDRNPGVRLDVNITSSTLFCSELKNVLSKYISTNFYLGRTKNCGPFTSILSSCGVQQVYIFLNWLYSNCNIYLNRKYQKFLEIKTQLIEAKLVTN